MIDSAVAPAIELHGVSKTFAGRRTATVALRDVELHVGAGEFVSLLGPSGCGKSTLLRIIGGLVDADTGRVLVNGEEPERARALKHYGFVPQTPALLPWRTVDENVRLLTRLNRHAPNERELSEDQIAALLARVGLAGFASAYPHELSGGMQQRVSLIRAFALGAPILLMDEPFAALDEITRADMRYLLADLWENSDSTVVFVTHSITEAVTLSDRVLVLAARPGRVVSDVAIPLTRPRHDDLEDRDEFHHLVGKLRHLLRESHAA